MRGEPPRVHVCTVAELVRSLEERAGLSEHEATELVARVLREDPRRLSVRLRLSIEARLRIEDLAARYTVTAPPLAAVL